MKSSMKLIGLFFVLALMIVSPVLAQETPNPLCNGLEAADCEVLTAPGEEAKSFSIPAWSINFEMTSPEGDMAFAASGSGQFMAPAEGSTEGLLVHLFIDDATMTSAGTTETGALEILVIGDMVYLQSEGKWYGGTIEEAGLPVDPTALSSGTFDMSTLSGDFSASVTTARGADAEVSGASVAVFTTSINLGQMIATVVADPAVTAQIPAEQLETVQMVGMLIPTLLANTTLTVEQSVGVDDGFIHKLVVAMPFDLDLAMLEMGQVTGSFDFSAEVADFNSTFEATAPESYEPLSSMTTTSGM